MLAAKTVSSSCSWAGRTSPRQSYVCEEALTLRANRLRIHAGIGAGPTNSEVFATRAWEQITRARHPF